MSQDWEWVSLEGHGWESILTGSDAAYDCLLQTRAHATIRKTIDGEYFWQFSGTYHGEEEDEPKCYASLTDCQRSCEEAVKIRQVTDKLDGK